MIQVKGLPAGGYLVSMKGRLLKESAVCRDALALFDSLDFLKNKVAEGGVQLDLDAVINLAEEVRNRG